MCLIFIGLAAHPRYKLLIAANRDEFYERQTVPAHFWNEKPEILAGRDLEAGGTWLGLTREGRFSLVTNYRDMRNLKTGTPSRGALVSDFLSSQKPPADYLAELVPRAPQYNGYNLLVGTVDEIHYHSNYQHGIRAVEPGIHGLSNHLLNTPWPKVSKGKEKFQQLLTQAQIDPLHLLDLLRDEQVARDEELPDTGLDLERERALSPMFIRYPGYGTRCSTVVMVGWNNQVTFIERTYQQGEPVEGDRLFEFTVPLPARHLR